mmetsp:Transcript_21206/g.15212  ORF Transcript_21206/g.15212 Transcript_21206/m.15212 type:complete len:86 (+) Transcript_21206:108-365(+)
MTKQQSTKRVSRVCVEESKNLEEPQQTREVPAVDLVDNLADMFNLGDDVFLESPLIGDNIEKSIFGGSGFMPSDTFMQDDAFVSA